MMTIPSQSRYVTRIPTNIDQISINIINNRIIQIISNQVIVCSVFLVEKQSLVKFFDVIVLFRSHDPD